MKKTHSQNSWLKRQQKDFFFKSSKLDGYRSRASYKLIEVNKKFKLINRNTKVIDLGCSPGGWAQVVSEIIKPDQNDFIAIDKLNMNEIKNCIFIQEKIEKLLEAGDPRLKEKHYDLILSDMAPSSSGHKFTDLARSEEICYLALEFCTRYLIPNGNLICKLMRNSSEKNIIKSARKTFRDVKVFKPKASRKESKEIYLIGLGFL